MTARLPPPSLLGALLVVCEALNVEPFLVGGSLRDTLLGRSVQRWDVVTLNAQRVARTLSRRLKSRCVVLNQHHRIFRLSHASWTIDLANPEGGTVLKDLAGRDFTMNAMAQSLRTGEMIDPFKGQRDLKLKSIRAVSATVFSKDPLRLLRAFRFSAQLEFSVEPRTRRWIRAAAQRLSTVSPERLREEWMRLLSQPRTAETLKAMDRAKLLSVLIPDVDTCRRTAVRFYGSGGVLTHLLHTVAHVEWLLTSQRVSPKVDAMLRTYSQHLIGGFPRAAWLKLGALLHDLGKPATAKMFRGRLRFWGHAEVGARITDVLLRQWRFSRQEILLVKRWVLHHMRLGQMAATKTLPEKAIGRFMRKMGEEGVGQLIISLADHYDYLARSRWGKGTDPVEKLTEKLWTLYSTPPKKVLARLIDGHQIMKEFRLKPGPLIGELLELVKDGQVERAVTTKREALELLKKDLRVFGSTGLRNGVKGVS